MTSTSNVEKCDFSPYKSLATLRAMKAANITFSNCTLTFPVSGCINGHEPRTGDVLYFFPTKELYKFGEDAVQPALADIKKNWKDFSFEIAEEKILPANTYAEISFESLFFRLKSVH